MIKCFVRSITFIFCINLSAFWHQSKYQFYKEKPDIFPLELLPSEIQNEIAQYLPLHKTEETDKEFVERLLSIDNYNKDNPCTHGKLTFSCGDSIKKYPAIYEQFENRKKIAWKYPVGKFIANFLNGNWEEKTRINIFTIADDLSSAAMIFVTPRLEQYLYIYNFKTKKTCKENLENYNISSPADNIAISKSGIYVAYANWKKVRLYDTRIQSFLNIKEITFYDDLKEIQFVDGLAFNYQGTKLGVRFGFLYKHIAEISLPTVENQAQEQSKQKNLLALYFRQHGICKNWSQS